MSSALPEGAEQGPKPSQKDPFSLNPPKDEFQDLKTCMICYQDVNPS
jgi:hypothetical protein